MLDSELPTIPLASFNNLQGILSSPVAFLSFILPNNLLTVVTLGAFREKHCVWGDDNTLVWHLFWVSPLPGQGFCHFGWEFITLSSILISGMLRFFPHFFLYDVTHVARLLDPMFCTGPLCSFPEYP